MELQRVKKDRDTLLEVAQRAQDALEEVDSLKAEVEAWKAKNVALENKVKIVESEQAELEGTVKREREQKIELEKKLAAADEKLVFLKEERVRMDEILRSAAKIMDPVCFCKPVAMKN